jgi:multidrug efflux pump subunit AcrB
MALIRFAMRHPITMVMVVVALFGAGCYAVLKMRVDIFPTFDLPEIYIIQNYNGMSPSQIEGLLVNQIELNLQYVDGIQEVESRSIQQIALIKVKFFPGTDVGQAMAAVVAQVNRASAFMPPGVLPPQIIRMDPGSIPIGYLVLTGKSESLGTMADLAEYRIRPLVQKLVPGTVGTAPFGANVRTLVITVDPDRLRSYDLTPDDVSRALAQGNVVIPAGNLYIRDQMPIVPTNAMVGQEIHRLGDIPLRTDRNVYIRNVATISDSTDINYGYAMVDGKRSVYIPIVKKNTASALTVVSDIRKGMSRFRSVLPEGVDVRYEFDQSPVVVDAILSLALEGAMGAGLTGLMVLIFLRDWRSVLVVVANIPLALLGALAALWLCGQTTNIMTLGGLALAIGMLVDEATVCIENIHVQVEGTGSLARAVKRGSKETAVPRLLAMLCILSVFIPAFLMAEPVHSLFVPLSLAVAFAMISSYVLSSTFVPVLAVWLLRHPGTSNARSSPSLFDRFRKSHGRAVGFIVRWRWIFVPAYFAVSLGVLAVLLLVLGRELFPEVNQGQFVLRFHMPPGTKYQLTRQAWVECLRVIEDEVGAGNVKISMGFAGQQAPDYAMNNMVLFMTGPDDGQMRVQLQGGSLSVPELRERLRKELPRRLKPWLSGVLRDMGYSPQQAEQRANLLKFGFQPGDIVSEVMTFGAPTPLEVLVSGHDMSEVREHTEKILVAMRQNEYLRDVQIHQTVDYPAVFVEIDRRKANLSGVTVDDVGRSVLEATSSSRMLQRNFWIDSKAGVSYQVQVQTPITRMTSEAQVKDVPIKEITPGINLLVRDVASVGKGFVVGEYDRTQMERYLSVTANVHGEDVGRAAEQIQEAIEEAGSPPRGVHVESRGQVKPMDEMFSSMYLGLGISICVILVLLTGYFQSLRMAVAALGAVPGVLMGVAVILFFTGTRLNIESFMGAIMSIGVSVSNSVMLVAFIGMGWEKHGLPVQQAAIEGAEERLRPILMTACAMIAGMVPMAMGLESGAKMEAPLGRAVIGGLALSTFATLLILPAFFTVLLGEKKYHSSSVDPDDPESKHFDREGQENGEASRERPDTHPTLHRGETSRERERPGQDQFQERDGGNR